ncbi:MAG: AAA family ATPase [Kofleriaceae bacterium]
MNVLWLLVSIELEPLLARAAQVLMSPGMHELSAQILTRLATTEHLECDGKVLERLSRFALIELDSDPHVPLYRRAIRPNDRVIELARGSLDATDDLAAIAQLIPAADTQRETAEMALSVPPELVHAVTMNASVLIVATGIEGSGRATLLRHAASIAGRAVLAVRSSALAVDPAKLSRQLRAIARECRLYGAWPLLLDVDELVDRTAAVDVELISGHVGPLLATSREACTWRMTRPLVTVPVEMPDEGHRHNMWRRAFPAAGDDVIQAAAQRYVISPGLLARAATSVAAVADRPDLVTTDHVHRALRVHLERRLSGLAQRIETKQTWEDLVIPVDQFDLLIELVARVRHRRQVLDTWGFSDKVGKGIGLSVLLSGPPGTGKSMIAGLVASELGLDLYQIDLSRIVSKYIGETEKQLASLFEAAESGHAILLFDEADSLFGKRTEVKSSNDRYANLEVNYLLQRMEAFSGISILTTNHETAIDTAFQRRLALHVRVPMPDKEQRAALWRAMLPDRAARAAKLDFESLAAEFVMSGGYIKNAVLRAAYFAADERVPINHIHLRRAARAEYEAMGMITFQHP